MSIVYGTPNLETGGSYEITGFTWPELEDYLAEAWYGTKPPLALFMHHTYRPVAPADISLVDTMKLTAGILRYFFHQGWRPFGKGPHLFCSPVGGVLAWPVSRDGYHVVWHNERTLGVEFMFDGEAGPAPKWAVDGWIRICRALRRSVAQIPSDRQHMRLHRDFTAGSVNDQVARSIDLAGADFTRYADRKSCPGRQVLEAQIYPPLWAALNEDDMDGRPGTFIRRTGIVTLPADVNFNAFRYLGRNVDGTPNLKRLNGIRYTKATSATVMGLAHWDAATPASACYVVTPYAWLGDHGDQVLIWWSSNPLPGPKVTWDPTATEATAIANRRTEALRSDAVARLERLSRQATADAVALKEP